MTKENKSFEKGEKNEKKNKNYGTIEVRVKKIGINSPEDNLLKETNTSLSYDLRYAGEDIEIKPGEILELGTGLAFELNINIEAQIRSLPTLATKGLIVLNSINFNTKNYPNEIKVAMINHGIVSYFIKHSERIAQVVFVKIPKADIKYIEDSPTQARKTGTTHKKRI
jgi:dUTP pyrophosphatase